MMSPWLLLRRCTIVTAITVLSFILWRQLTTPIDFSGGEATYKKAQVLPREPAPAQADSPQSEETPTRDPFVSITPPAPPAPPAVTPLAPTLTLVGTGIGPPSFALIHSNATGVGLRVVRGMTVEGWDIIDIRKNNLVVSHQNTTWIIGFSPEPAKQCATPQC